MSTEEEDIQTMLAFLPRQLQWRLVCIISERAHAQGMAKGLADGIDTLKREVQLWRRIALPRKTKRRPAPTPAQEKPQ